MVSSLLAVACYSTYDFTYHVNRVRRDEDDGEWFTDPEHHWQAFDLMKCVVITVLYHEALLKIDGTGSETHNIYKWPRPLLTGKNEVDNVNSNTRLLTVFCLLCSIEVFEVSKFGCCHCLFSPVICYWMLA